MRTIVSRHAGSPRGLIRRMVDPGDLGERLKPFVFLDFIEGEVERGTGFGFHPHSGIATLTYHLDADVQYQDTAGQKGVVEATGLEWMCAGGGTWHQGFIFPRDRATTGFQLWLALPPAIEDGPARGTYLPPDAVPQVGNVRVLLGAYGGATNPIAVPSPVTYLDVTLAAGELWRFEPPADQTVAWAFVYRGRACVAGEAVASELVVLDESTASIIAEAVEPTRLLLGSARKHDHSLILGSHSVHTNPASLAEGTRRIAAIGAELRRDGRLRPGA